MSYRYDTPMESALLVYLLGAAVGFDREVRELNTAAVLNWRRRFRQRLDLVAAKYPPRIAVSLDDLADMLSVIADGGIILSKTVNDKQALARQILLYRDFIRSVFLGV